MPGTSATLSAAAANRLTCSGVAPGAQAASPSLCIRIRAGSGVCSMRQAALASVSWRSTFVSRPSRALISDRKGEASIMSEAGTTTTCRTPICYRGLCHENRCLQHSQPERELVQVVLAPCRIRRALCTVQSRQQHRRQDGDNGDDHQQLNQCERANNREPRCECGVSPQEEIGRRRFIILQA